jgi:hypothetical protein
VAKLWAKMAELLGTMLEQQTPRLASIVQSLGRPPNLDSDGGLIGGVTRETADCWLPKRVKIAALYIFSVDKARAFCLFVL